jgi:NADPH-ferrihemoprotein reductase
VEILLEFPSINLPVAVALCEILPKNTLRYYSISSSSLKDPHIVSITAVVVRYAIAVPITGAKKQNVVIRGGLMTTYLERLHNERVTSLPPARNDGGVPRFYVPMYIRQSAFKLPKVGVPVIMVGPGTGINLSLLF